MTFRPLEATRVLDLTTFLSGPFATQVLGDLGADVIKVESPEGDQTRSLPPHFVGPDSAYFLHVNRNKRSLVIDLKTAAGRKLLWRVAKSCDVVVENFRPGVVARLGLDYSRLVAVNPGVIWCSISGFGQTGPYRDRPAYDMIVQALSGAMSLTGEPGRSPVRLGVPLGDLAAGLYAVIGILAAVSERTVTGTGRRLDIAMLDALVSLLSYQATYALMSNVNPPPQGRGHDSIPTYRCFRTGDGVEIAVTANTERMWQGLCEALGLDALPGDPRFVRNEDRYHNRAELDPILEAAFVSFQSTEILERLHIRFVPAAPVATVLEALNDSQVRARRMVETLNADDGRSVPVIATPIRVEGASPVPPRYPPLLGEHSREVLERVFGMTRKEIDGLASDGVIGHSWSRSGAHIAS